jgi:hypothetical protein
LRRLAAIQHSTIEDENENENESEHDNENDNENEHENESDAHVKNEKTRASEGYNRGV